LSCRPPPRTRPALQDPQDQQTPTAARTSQPRRPRRIGPHGSPDLSRTYSQAARWKALALLLPVALTEEPGPTQTQSTSSAATPGLRSLTVAALNGRTTLSVLIPSVTAVLIVVDETVGIDGEALACQRLRP